MRRRLPVFGVLFVFALVVSACEVWQPSEAPVPLNAATNPTVEFAVGSVSCPTEGSCTAVGSYKAGDGLRYGLIDTFSARARTAIVAPEPANATPHRYSQLFAVSCAARSACTAVGAYTDMTNHDRGLIDMRSNGAWTAMEAPLPGPTTTAHLNAVSCASPTSCLAVGYFDGGTLIETFSAGRWTFTTAPMPPNATTTAVLTAVSCPAPGSCTAVGWYDDTNNHRDGLIDRLSGGTWTTTQAPLPPNASTAPFQLAQLFSVSCSAPESCTAVGNYIDNNGAFVGLIDTLSAGAWAPIEAPEPANAGSDTSGNVPSTGLYSVSCTRDGACTAVGTYRTKTVTFVPPTVVQNYGGLIDTRANGTWIATQASEPTNGGAPPSHVEHTNLNSVSCRSARACTGVGEYFDAHSHPAGLINTVSDGTWQAIQAPEPANGAGTDANLNSVSCTGGGACAAVGTYTDTANATQGVLETLSSCPGRAPDRACPAAARAP